jgi:flagellar biosynthesis/type III secretory pathway chaperone
MGIEKLMELSKDNPDLKAEVEEITSIIEKLSTANKDLVNDRRMLDEKVKSTNKLYEDLKAEKEAISKNVLPEDELKKLLKLRETGMNDETAIKINTLLDEVKTIKADLEAEKIRSTQAFEKSKEAKKRAAVIAAESELVSNLTTAGISPDDAKLVLSFYRDKHLKLEEDPSTGDYKAILYKVKDGAEVSATAEDIAKEIAAKHERLVAATGTTGTGQTHTSSPKPSSGGVFDINAAREQAEKNIFARS